MAEKLKMMSDDIIQENIDYIASKFPNALKECKDDNGKLVKRIDFDILKQELSNVVIDDKKERYQMTWPDKKKSILLANSKINATLRPVKEKSVDFDNTQNLYIEGDNLDVLKLLRETYLNKVKMIYIDPPYNTGNDFVYEDDFTQSSEEYLSKSGQYDEQGNRLVANSDSNGRFHTDWLNMMYPRLKVARDLLTDDGVILISIDEAEYYNLLKVCNEIFGESNYIENFIWIKNSTKNLSKTTSTNHEYILCYAKNKVELENKNFFRVEKPGLKEVQAILDKANNENWTEKETEAKLKEYYNDNPELKGISGYDRVEKRYDEKSQQTRYQAYTLSDASAPKSTGSAPKYDVIHPVTGVACKSPSRGWAFTRSKMDELIKQNLIYFYENETYVPAFKRFLDTVTTEIIKSAFEDFTDGKKELQRIFDGNAPFDNAKPTTVLSKFISLLGDDDIFLDFFSGSASSADALMQLNFKDSFNRKFILVQIPEKCPEKTEGYKMGYKTICDIGEERIRRAGKKIKDELIEKKNKAGLLADDVMNPDSLDIGFRVLKLDSSNMNDVYYNPNAMTQSLLDETVDNIKPDRTPLDLLFQVMLELGIELSAKIEEKEVNGKHYYQVNDNDIVACFDDDLDNDILTEIAKLQPLYAVFKDSSFSTDSVGINNEQIFKTYSPQTKIKVL